MSSVFGPISDRIVAFKLANFRSKSKQDEMKEKKRLILKPKSSSVRCAMQRSSGTWTKCERCRRIASMSHITNRNHSLNAKITMNSEMLLSLLEREKIDYEVKESDTLTRIAAVHDCTVGELMKLNRLNSRMVFAGQKLVVPLAIPVDSCSTDVDRVSTDQQSVEANRVSGEDGIRKGPGTAVLVNSTPEAVSSNLTQAQEIIVEPQKKLDVSDNDADTDCLRKFLKIKVKQINEKHGTVSGTLLVTPNALMFDPDVTHPLVIENGQDLYMMMARMEEISSVTMYRDVAALADEKDHEGEIYDPLAVVHDDEKISLQEKLCDDLTKASSEFSKENQLPIILNDSGDANINIISKEGKESQIKTASNDSCSDNRVNDTEPTASVQDIDSSSDMHQCDGDSQKISSKIAKNDVLQRSVSESTASSSVAEIHDSDALSHIALSSSSAYSLLKIGRTLSAHANVIRGSVASGAERMTQSAMTGTMNVAHGVASHTRNAAETLQLGAKAAATHAKVAVDVVASMPQGLVGSSPFVEGQSESAHESVGSGAKLRRNESLAMLLALKEKTTIARENVSKQREEITFSCATSFDDKPDLFRPFSELGVSLSSASKCITSTASDPPYYMIVRIHRNCKKERRQLKGGRSLDSFERDKNDIQTDQRFWYAIPRQRVHPIYCFLLQWNPEKYGQEGEECEEGSEMYDTVVEEGIDLSINDFVVLDTEVDAILTGDEPGDQQFFGKNSLDRQWEIVSVQEMCRRLSIDQPEKKLLPLPDGSQTSRILDESMIRQIVNILPARAEAYPWVLIYSSEKYGFSLSTLYRKMIAWTDVLSPILIIISDCSDNIFGAVASSALRPSEHFFGTGDSSCLFKFKQRSDTNERVLHCYRWTGKNQYFVQASKDSFLMGAGSGHYGLWLDSDLNYGRSQKCDTFDNEPLAGDDSDFTVHSIEAFGFSIL